jgi:6-phosphogluconolactonase
MAEPPYFDYMPWSHTHIFWGDERMVPADHPDSNYAMSLESLVSRVPIPKANLHRPDTGLGDPAATAESYESDLKKFFSGLPPRFDHILLGMGADGHTASIFPGDKTAVDTRRWVCAVQPPPTAEPAVARVTFSLPLINQARCVHFLVSGASKMKIVRKIERQPASANKKYPAARVRPEGELVWFVDDGI